MAYEKKESVLPLIEIMKETQIKDEINHLLGPGGRVLRTWGDVHIFMQRRANSLSPNVVKDLKQKLEEEFMLKKGSEEVKETKYDLTPLSNRRTTNTLIRVTPIPDSETFARTETVQHDDNRDAVAEQDDLDSASTSPVEESSDMGFYLELAQLLRYVKPNEVTRVVGIIVRLAASYNTKGDAKVEEGWETPGTETPKGSSNAKSIKGKGKAIEGHDTRADKKDLSSTSSVAPPAPAPSRDWRDSKGNDPGYAYRQQLLNPVPDPWDRIE